MTDYRVKRQQAPFSKVATLSGKQQHRNLTSLINKQNAQTLFGRTTFSSHGSLLSDFGSSQNGARLTTTGSVDCLNPIDV